MIFIHKWIICIYIRRRICAKTKCNVRDTNVIVLVVPFCAVSCFVNMCVLWLIVKVSNSLCVVIAMLIS
jgi:hypothetical protein